MRSDFRRLRYFVAVAEELHFRRAAERLGIAQPALSRAIRTIEDEMGAVLFSRSNRVVNLTPAGQIFLERAYEILSLSERAGRDVRNAHEGRAGTLRIGYTDFAIAGPLPELLNDFQILQPQITLRPQHGVTLTQLKRLAEGKLDIGFVTGPVNAPGYAQRPIHAERLVCVCPDSHAFARRDDIRLADLADEDFVHGGATDWQYFYDYLNPLCRRAGFMPRIAQEAFNTAGILGLVACGMGVTVLTESVVRTLGPGLRVVPIRDVSEQLITCAIWRQDQTRGPISHFVDYLENLPVA
ncbi:LysR family transcriptional regulator [Roseobacter sp. HKCCD9010]|uniref:LysR family transcriptional regulator n=1 Tax=unclassified Roseobacter TaxID=196798 RepID=UPI001490EE57|nr:MULTISPECIES: LysR family transcriptional regulator [unclassified Roseobacter]MBF9052560.1 LysR family transcriptional regulator [Rhodobacterales bacterium HKCCD4356]NNV14028.1 LysR family transcriptional regulator [Roseobacter sp. HKCCD7357]NNV18298.1 LysR family transcriptional regulator [Roseobacter sp. HKCCD8768]NNV27727.1 LysR family transcriptional regulator [Roseobacter sp. HKCCD8192]NNV32002.1 LysR family transcriptional regulator [Roseobacter sp. HKCCD9061]